jgi:hypothetical protein
MLPFTARYMRAVGSEYEAVLEATCTAEAGTVLRWGRAGSTSMWLVAGQGFAVTQIVEQPMHP